jgi:hypothetical protein
MESSETQFYRQVIDGLRTALIDLDYCFASDDAKRALDAAIDPCEADYRQKVSGQSQSSRQWQEWVDC